MSIEQTLGKAFIEELNKRDFYVVKDDGQRIEIEHSKTQVKIVVKCSQDDIYTVNFENKKGDKFLKSDWYLGNEFGLCRDDIITIISKPEFIAFSDVSLSEKKTEQQNRITLLKKMFADEIERFYEILQHFNFQLVNEVDKAIYIQNDELAMTIKIYYKDDNVWAEELLTGLTRYIGSLDEKKADILIIFLEDRIIQKSQETPQDRLTQKEKEHKPIAYFTGGTTDTQQEIGRVCAEISNLLIYKNQKYGNSALKPNNIFYKGNAETSILIRLDDKIGRIKNNPDDELRYNDVVDIIGYLVLYLILKDIRPEDIQKLKD